MTDAAPRIGRRGSLAERVEERLARDFPGAAVPLGSDPADLDGSRVRAVAVPARELPADPLPGRDHFAFPAEEPLSGAALLFREGDRLLLEIRRFYLPPVTIAGAGPGGAGSMTFDAGRAVARADVIFVDCLCGRDVLRFARPGAEIVPVGKRCGKPSVSQEEINRGLVREARRGRRVVRLKGGDPGVFGRLEEETGALRALHLPYRVLPGVGAASAAAAFLGQPLTVRERAAEIIFSTGRLAGGGKNPFPLRGTHTPAIALYMSRRVLADRLADLRAAGYPPDTPAAVVEKIGSPAARAVTGTIATLPALADREGVGTPAVVLVGRQFHVPDHLPLAGIRIWLPAERETAESQKRYLTELGATCIEEPLIEPVAIPVDRGLLFGRRYDWVVFTSKKSPDFFFDLLRQWGFDLRALPRVAAIGNPTIEKLRARGIEPDLIPPEPTRVALSDALIRSGLSGRRVLIPASAAAPDAVREALRPHAAEVVRMDLYTLRFPEVRAVPEADVVLFSSESTVRSAKRNGLLPRIRERGMVVGGIGPATTGRLDREGLPAAIVPEGTSPGSLARAVRRHFANLSIAALAGEAR